MVSLLKWSVARKYKAPRFEFPYACGPLPRILVILPEEPLAALHQVSCLTSVAAHFKAAHLVALCEKRVAPFFKTLGTVSKFMEYDAADRYLFSREFDGIGREISAGRFDMCLMLEPNPDLSLLYCAGKSAAQVRIGIKGAGDYPFLNLHVNPAPCRTYLTDRSMLLAAMLGVPSGPKARWSVTREAADEAGLMLREMKVPLAARLIGIDGAYFYRRHGRQWTQSLLDMLQKKPFVCWLFSHGEPGGDAAAWAGERNLPLLADLPAARSAAVISKSEFVVAGPTVLFELADLLRTSAVGVFEEAELGTYCRESATSRGLGYVSRPDGSTIDAIERCVDAMPVKR